MSSKTKEEEEIKAWLAKAINQIVRKKWRDYIETLEKQDD